VTGVEAGSVTGGGRSPKTLVIGLGNPIVTDDGVGIRVAREVRRRLEDLVGMAAGQRQGGNQVRGLVQAQAKDQAGEARPLQATPPGAGGPWTPTGFFADALRVGEKGDLVEARAESVGQGHAYGPEAVDRSQTFSPSLGEKVAECRMRGATGASPMPDVLEICVGGLRLMEAMVGYERAVLIDALLAPELAPGTIREFPADDLACTKNACCSHDTSFGKALEMGRTLGLALPGEIRVIGIVAGDVETFGETLTGAVAAAVPTATAAVLGYLGYAKEKMTS